MESTTAGQYTTSPPLSQVAELLSLIPGRRPGVSTVRLNLPFRPVFIGEIDSAGDGTFRKRVSPEKHVHRDTQSIAISAALLHSEFRFRWIVIDTPSGKLATSRAFFVAHARPHQFRGYEPQLFLGVELFGVDKARVWEAHEERRARERAAQLSMFCEAAA